jgi:hypothetical protein
MSALASFFILFRLDLASLLWKIYLWVGGFFVTNALQFDQVTGDGRTAEHSRPMPPFAGHRWPMLLCIIYDGLFCCLDHRHKGS